MYTAKITRKVKDQNKTWIFDVTFTNGTDTFTEQIKPQDRDGFMFWLKQRLASLNNLDEFVDEDNLDQDIVIPTTPLPTQTELDKQAWFAKYYELEQLQKIAEKAFLTGPRLTALNNKITSTKAFLDTKVKVEYLDFV
jgi:hypothetical protein